MGVLKAAAYLAEKRESVLDRLDKGLVNAHKGAVNTIKETIDEHIDERDTNSPIYHSVKHMASHVTGTIGTFVALLILASGSVWLCYGGARTDNSIYSVVGKAIILVITGGIVLSTWARLLSGDQSAFQTAGAYFDAHVRSPAMNHLQTSVQHITNPISNGHHIHHGGGGHGHHHHHH